MFLSQVILNPRHHDTYRLLADIYAQHRFVMSAFPDRGDDEGNAEGGRSEGEVLYRVDTGPEGRICLLVQSAKAPNWKKASDLHLGVMCSAEEKQDNRNFENGARFRFRLRANPTVCRVNRDAEGSRNPKREGLFKESEQLEWLSRAAERSGFTVNIEAVLVTPRGKREGTKLSPQVGRRPQTITSYAVDFDGMLVVTNRERFVQALHEGIGRGKAWGCGLLSVVRSSR